MIRPALCMLLLAGFFWAGCGGGSNGSSAAGPSQNEQAEQFKGKLAELPDKRIKDTLIGWSNDSIRVLLANYKVPTDSLVEDIGFDQVEARLLVMRSNEELHRAHIGVNWGRKQLNRSDLNFSPLIDFKLESTEDNNLKFRCMLVEYDQNKMHNLNYVVDATGKVTCQSDS